MLFETTDRVSPQSPCPPSPSAKSWYRHRSVLALIGIVSSLAAVWLVPGASHPKAPLMAGLCVLMASFWVFEVIPIPVTALFPIVLFPVLGLSDARTVTAYYARPTIFLFLGGFLLALGLQKTGVHRRIALSIIHAIGSRASRLVLGFMIASGLLSMWISNTASVMVMMPIGLSLLEELKAQGVSDQVRAPLAVCLMLGIAYAADIGGMATLIGTPPNLVFVELMGEIFPNAPPIAFSDWMRLGLPISALFMLGGWLLLSRVIYRLPQEVLFSKTSTVARLRASLGPIRKDELLAAGVFMTAALLWMTGAKIELNEGLSFMGWRAAANLSWVTDPVVAVGCAALLFMVPSSDRPQEALLEWEDAKEVPWGILLLFGGGFALAGGFASSGLSELVGQVFSSVKAHPFVVILVVCVLLTALTEFTSNTATTNLVLPVLAKAGIALGIDPRALMIPATLSASCAFMMPVASPTQAIIFGSGHVTIREMMRAGIWFNVLGVALVWAVFILLGPVVLGIDFQALPAWVH